MLVLLLALTASAINVEQVHVASGSDPSTATFAWSTRFNCSSSTVRIGESPCNSTSCLTQYFFGNSTLLETGDNSQYIHKVPVKVQPKNYSYQVGCILGWSEIFTYQAPGQLNHSTFVVYGDLSIVANGKATWESVASFVGKEYVDAILHVGDISYDLFHNDNRHGDDYMNTIQPVASRIPYMVIAGNHEKGDNYQSYDSRFAMPGNNFYTTYTIGQVRFVGIDTEYIISAGKLTQPTLAFLKTILNRSEEDKAQFPWLIVMGHRPLYCCARHLFYCTADAAVMRSVLEDLFYSAGVDLYINGHLHDYQRTTPVYRGDPINTPLDIEFGYGNAEAPIYVTTGGPGNDEPQVKITPDADWYGAGTDEYAYGRIRVYNNTHLYWEQWLSETEVLADSFWVIKSPKA